MAVAAAATASAATFFPTSDGKHHCAYYGNADKHEYDNIIYSHRNSLPTLYTRNAISHAMLHCITMMPSVDKRELNSRRMAATAATHGVYSRVNTRKLQAASVDGNAAGNMV